jgi:hypothetical protein
MRFTKETPLPEFWAWEGDNLGFSDEWLKKRPLSYSSLSKFLDSPRHYASKFITGAQASTAAQSLGKIVEALIFETNESFERQFRIYVPEKGTGSVAKNAEIKAEAMRAKVELITQEEYDRATYCKIGVMDNDLARTLIEKRTSYQRKVSWTNRETKLPMVGFMDFETVWGDDFIVDFKTAQSADPDDFSRDFAKWKYHIQGASYTDAIRVLEYRFPHFINMVVETKEPYNVSVNFVEGRTLERARDEYLGALQAFNIAKEQKLFHQGYEFRLFETGDYFPLRLPSWYKPKYGGYKE